MKIRLSPLDKLFSEFIRKRAIAMSQGCERCLSYKADYKELQCSHFYGRSRRSVRWDEDNAVGLCFGCHQYLSSHPQEHVDFFKQRLEDRFDMLEGRMRQIGKPDIEALTLYYTEKIKEEDNGLQP